MANDTTVNINRDLAENGMFSTISGEDQAGRIKLFKAINSATNLRKAIKDAKGALKFTLQDIIMQRTEWTDNTTGSVTEGVRTILIDTDGKVYSSSSSVIAQRMGDFLAVVGHPRSWEEPMTLKFEERDGRGVNRFVTFDVL